MLDGKRRIHLIGIGGTGMSALARVLHEAGYTVTGSDLNLSPAAVSVAQLGVVVRQGHHAENVEGCELVVVSSAIPTGNPEIVRASELGIPVVKRAEVLGELTRAKRSILVAGTHGKTTTTSMIAVALEQGGLSPTILVGGEVADLGTSARLGSGDYLVAEADEYDATFLKLAPWIAVVTNVEPDHLDFYANFDAIVDAFDRFLRLVPDDGCGVLCWDDPTLRRLAAKLSLKTVSYGFSPGAEWRATRVRRNVRWGNDFTVLRSGRRLARLSLAIPGKHNVLNALAATAVGSELGLSMERIAISLAQFKGALRRFEYKGQAGGVVVYDDYAHHPTEIAATLRAARERHSGRIWAVFQPHTYNRTKHMLQDFARALELADCVVVTDVYAPAGREMETYEVSSKDIVSRMNHLCAHHIASLADAVDFLCGQLRPGDMLLTMGAGNVNQMAGEVLAQLAITDQHSADGQKVADR